MKGKAFKNHVEKLVSHFENIVKHSESDGLIHTSPDDLDDSSQAAINEIERWVNCNALFKE